LFIFRERVKVRLLPLVLLAVLVGVALVYTPLISTGTSPSFAPAQAPITDNKTMGTVTIENNTLSAQVKDRFMLQGEVPSPYGALIGPSIAVVFGLLVAAASYIIMKKGLMRLRTLSPPSI
jgi:hypothetical protein